MASRASVGGLELGGETALVTDGGGEARSLRTFLRE
jgi:hypothetical protein